MKNRLSRNLTSLDKYRKRVFETLSGPFAKLNESQRFWIGFAFLSLVTTLLISNPAWRTTNSEYKEGDIARESIISPADITVEDKEETRRIIEGARRGIKPIFTFQSNRPDEAAQTFLSAWEKLQRSIRATSASESEKASVKWTGAGGPDVADVFTARKFSKNEIDSVVRVLKQSSEGTIYDDKDRNQLKTEVTLIDPRHPTAETTVMMANTIWIPLSRARKKLQSGLGSIDSLSTVEIEAFDKALSPLVQPNVTYDSAATAKAIEDITKSVEPLMISLKRGQTIVREGDTINAKVLSQIAAIGSYSDSTRRINRFLGLFAIITALYWIAWKFMKHRGPVSRLALSEVKTFVHFGFIVIVQTVFMAIFFRLADFTAAQNLRAPLNDPTLWALAIPFGFPSLVMTLLVDRRTALFTGLFCAFLAGILAPKGLEFVLYAAISSSVAVYGIGRYQSRQSVTLAGVLVGTANAAAAVALIAFTQQPFILNTILLAISCGLASGLATAAVTAMFLPLCETLFGILTDVKLLELSNADLPVLGQLALRAPGTNQHSHAVGQLAEEACRVVGANGLLARIGALYHDIGKTAAPEYYVENQHGRNPHDRLKPSQSAKIIISHVSYGKKLAREMGLPARIIDFIPQHHGSRTLHYFLTKAKNQAGEEEEIHERDFRYPGPKPQFKEAAIMMIADSCEAAARSLSEPTPENIRFIVTKIIDAILADDQLDECDLTLRELTRVRESMIKSLISIYHSRVDYPGYTPPSKSMENIIVPKDLGSGEHHTLYKDPADIPISLGGEIEDEAIDHSKQPEPSDLKAKGSE